MKCQVWYKVHFASGSLTSDTDSETKSWILTILNVLV